MGPATSEAAEGIVTKACPRSVDDIEAISEALVSPET